jgi:hypothetical protein
MKMSGELHIRPLYRPVTAGYGIRSKDNALSIALLENPSEHMPRICTSVQSHEPEMYCVQLGKLVQHDTIVVDHRDTTDGLENGVSPRLSIIQSYSKAMSSPSIIFSVSSYCHTFVIIPFYLQPVPVNSTNCVKFMLWHVEEWSVVPLCKY